MKRRLLAMAVALAVVFGGLLFWNVVRQDLRIRYLDEHAPGPRAVTVMEVREEPWQPLLSALGTLGAAEQVQVTAQVGGRVTEISFEEGREVKQGEVLVVLDDAMLREQLEQATEERDVARDALARYRPLLEEGGISQLHYDQLEAKYRESRDQVAQARAQLEHVRIVAPVSGRVAAGHIGLGQLLEPGAQIATLDVEPHLYCDFNLPQSERGKVFVGQEVRLRADAQSDESLLGRISSVGSSIDATTRKFGLRASFPDEDPKLAPGVMAKVQVLLPAGDDVIVVPRTAIVYTLSGDTVYVLDPDSEQERDGMQAFQVMKVAVTSGEERENQVVISTGLKAGQSIVTSGQLKLEDGDWVAPLPSDVNLPNEPPLD